MYLWTVDAPAHVTGLSDSELETFKALWVTWRDKSRRNLLRSSYLDAKVPVKDLFISTPPSVAGRIQAVLGWPAKAVNMLADQTRFEGFVSESGEPDPFGINDVLDANRFEIEFPQALRSAYTHSCAFYTVSQGDGPGDVLLMPRSAASSAALWDRRSRRISAMMAITDVDNEGLPVGIEMFLPDWTIRLEKQTRWAVADRVPNRLGEVMVEPIVFDPTLDRPFGRSRISRAVMAITDNAMRTILRSEVAAEFYTAPRMAAIGVSEDAFQAGKWQMAIDRWVGFTRDEDGNAPSVQQFSQMTMQPLLDQYRAYASQFSAETGIPVSSLGIVQDNPPSAESMYAAKEDLIATGKNANIIHNGSLRRLAWKILAVRDGQVPDEARSLTARFANPAFTAPATAADALSKLVAVFPWMSDSEVALEYAGFSRPEVLRLLSDKRRAEGGAILDRLLAGDGQ